MGLDMTWPYVSKSGTMPIGAGFQDTTDSVLGVSNNHNTGTQKILSLTLNLMQTYKPGG